MHKEERVYGASASNIPMITTRHFEDGLCVEVEDAHTSLNFLSAFSLSSELRSGCHFLQTAVFH